MDKKKICIREINENLKRIFEDKPLTRHLKDLNKDCEFKKKYVAYFNYKNEERIKNEIKEIQKRYSLKNKDKFNTYCKRYYLNNKDKIKEIQKRYRLKNKDKIKEIQKRYRLKNKDKFNTYCKRYYLKNKNKILQRKKELNKIKKQNE